MTYYFLKIAITAILVVAVSEISKRSSIFGAILASVPLVSVLAIFWLYFETKNVAQVRALATNVFWLVLPSLVLFLTLPVLLRHGMNFYLSMSISIGITVACYFLMVFILTHHGIHL